MSMLEDLKCSLFTGDIQLAAIANAISIFQSLSYGDSLACILASVMKLIVSRRLNLHHHSILIDKKTNYS